jgi:uncharacterized ion transporter superfamily protein YfcC
MSLERLYRRGRRHVRFKVAVLLTIVVVATVAVPPVTRLLDTLRGGGYNPGSYEPKDAERQVWLDQPDSGLLGMIPWETAVNVTLFILVAIVWLTLVPTRRPPRH